MGVLRVGAQRQEESIKWMLAQIGMTTRSKNAP